MEEKRVALMKRRHEVFVHDAIVAKRDFLIEYRRSVMGKIMYMHGNNLFEAEPVGRTFITCH